MLWTIFVVLGFLWLPGIQSAHRRRPHPFAAGGCARGSCHQLAEWTARPSLERNETVNWNLRVRKVFKIAHILGNSSGYLEVVESADETA